MLSFMKQSNSLNFTSIEFAVQGALRRQQPSRSQSPPLYYKAFVELVILFIESIIIKNS